MPPLHPLHPSLLCFAACLTLIFQVCDTETLKLKQKFCSKRVTTVSLTFPDFSLALPIEREELQSQLSKDYKSLGIHTKINFLTHTKGNKKFCIIIQNYQGG